MTCLPMLFSGYVVTHGTESAPCADMGGRWFSPTHRNREQGRAAQTDRVCLVRDQVPAFVASAATPF